MKKLFAIILLCALALSGCGAKEPAEAPAQGGVEQPIAAGGADGARLEQLVRVDNSGIYTNLAPYNRVVTDFETGADSARYLDVAAAAERNIDPAFLGISGDGVRFSLFAASDRLFWISSGRTASDERGGATYICASGLDGSDMTKLVSYDDYVGEEGSTILFDELWYDGEYLYAFATADLGFDKPRDEELGVYPADAARLIKQSVHKIDARSGGIAAEFPIYEGADANISHEGSYESPYIFGAVYNSKLLFTTKKYSTKAERDAGMDPFVTTAWYTISTLDGSRENLPAAPDFKRMRNVRDDGDEALAARYGAVYGCDANREVYKIDTATGARTAVGALPAEYGEIMSGKQTIDSYLILRTCSVSGGNCDRAFAVNTGTGEITELTFKYMSDLGLMQPIEVYEVSETELCALIERRSEEVHTVFSGMPYEGEAFSYVYALISKADYFSNTANFRDITEAQK